MKTFSNFCKENQKNTNQTTPQDDAKQTIEQKYDELKDLNSDQLTKKLYEEVSKQKNEGVFDFETLCDSVERMRPFIPSETYQNMKQMLEKIK